MNDNKNESGREPTEIEKSVHDAIMNHYRERISGFHSIVIPQFFPPLLWNKTDENPELVKHIFRMMHIVESTSPNSSQGILVICADVIDGLGWLADEYAEEDEMMWLAAALILQRNLTYGLAMLRGMRAYGLEIPKMNKEPKE